MISLYRVTLTVEAHVIAARPDDAALTLSRNYREGSVLRVLDCRAELAPEVPGAVEALRPLDGIYIGPSDFPKDRRAWTCAQWAAALPGDVAAEAARLREEAAKAEATVAGLRATAAALETLAQPKAPAVSDAASPDENADAWVRITLRAERMDAETLVGRAAPFGFDAATIKSAMQRLIARGEVEVATDRTLGLRAQEGSR